MKSQLTTRHAPPLDQNKPSGRTKQDQLPVPPDIAEAPQEEEDGDITMLDAPHKHHRTARQTT